MAGLQQPLDEVAMHEAVGPASRVCCSSRAAIAATARPPLPIGVCAREAVLRPPRMSSGLRPATHASGEQATQAPPTHILKAGDLLETEARVNGPLQAGRQLQGFALFITAL